MLNRKSKKSSKIFLEAWAKIIVSSSKNAVQTIVNTENLLVKEVLEEYSKSKKDKVIELMLCEYVYFHLFFDSRRALKVGGLDLRTKYHSNVAPYVFRALSNEIYGRQSVKDKDKVEEGFAEGATQAEKVYSRCKVLIPNHSVPIDKESVSYALTALLSRHLYSDDDAFDSMLCMFNNIYLKNYSSDLDDGLLITLNDLV